MNKMKITGIVNCLPLLMCVYFQLSSAQQKGPDTTPDAMQDEADTEAGYILFPVFVALGALSGLLAMVLTLWMTYRYLRRHSTHYANNMVQGRPTLATGEKAADADHLLV